ncbi:ASAP3 isoform 13, partial [Pan troglodytes]
LEQAQAGTFAFPLHVDYSWVISTEPGSDSEEDEEEKRCLLKLPAQAHWASGRLDISNKTYETVASLGAATPQGENRSEVSSLSSEAPETPESLGSPASSSSLMSPLEPGDPSQAPPNSEEGLREPPGTSRPSLTSGTTPSEMYLPVRFSSESTRSYRRGARSPEDGPSARQPLPRRNVPVGITEGDGSRTGSLPASSVQLLQD